MDGGSKSYSALRLLLRASNWGNRSETRFLLLRKMGSIILEPLLVTLVAMREYALNGIPIRGKMRSVRSAPLQNEAWGLADSSNDLHHREALKPCSPKPSASEY